MRLSIASIALFAVSVLGVASAKDDLVDFGICSCFNPKFDASCCIPAKGFMMNDGNVCRTIDFKNSVKKYEDCCTRAGGKYKCKRGYRDPKHWPPADSYGCKV
ncbi:hypothetical protein BGX21_006508 [Mortierella sp. AD011]|nr:hypothetical protein BGX20_006333 [Mortierella sp. AD010]KAF9399280.1 hypothetical protein BGX21_006508 [Mortierella sp. AD011]